MEKALELDPENEVALLSQAWIEMTYEWDWASAERSHRRALELDPGNALSHHNYAYILALNHPNNVHVCSVEESEAGVEMVQDAL